ncbi:MULTISPECIES: hypothetical protein [Stenotrophomonas]|uniref:hypothetical protein n=1 Tax=Stenotrophomonas TaxID=40323 RepID=UPI000873097C|nr:MULTISPECIES: hypothetical protein [Stenotrophomonas]OEZ02287.1 hypothetical protein BIY45_01800 [Stenotrophomonas sp. BIIR7]
MTRARLLILLPLLIAATCCGVSAAGAALAFMADSYGGMLLARAILAGLVYLTTLEWIRAEQALRSGSSAADPVPAVPCDLQ